MEKANLIIFLLVVSMADLRSQPIDWIFPIEGKVLLSGTFGELRGSHYHTGIDIKPNTNGPQTIQAAADGYIKEIIVKGGSYGNGLLIQHKNGYQSLYGHLDRFVPALDSLVYAQQYKQEKFELNISLDSTQFPVHQGMAIGIMGNTGHSFGRHLHFEVRHESGTMYNPLLHLPEQQDRTPPQFRNLKINYYNGRGKEYQEKIISVNRIGTGQYQAGNLTLNSIRYSIGVDVVDLHESTHNRNGVYSLEMYLADSLLYSTTLDSLKKEDRKYYREHVDHKTSSSSSATYHNLKYKTNGIEAQLKNSRLGLIQPFPFQQQKFKIIATDYAGNKSKLEFTVQRVERPSIDYTEMYNYILPPEQSNKINLDQYSVIFPIGTFLQEERLYLFEEEIVSDNEAVQMIHMTQNQLPLYENALLLKKSNLPVADKKKWTLARCDDNGYKAISTIREKNQFAAYIRQLSSYCLVQDTIPPVIVYQPQSADKWFFKVTDNMHSFSQLSYSASVNNKWTLIQADNKNNRLIFKDHHRYRRDRQNIFVLEVQDACGNTMRFEQKFK